MKEEDILYECLRLIWDFGECYDSDDIYNFQHENLRTWTSYYKVINCFKQMQQSVKTLKKIEEFCNQNLDCLGTENRWFLDEIQDIANRTKE